MKICKKCNNVFPKEKLTNGFCDNCKNTAGLTIIKDDLPMQLVIEKEQIKKMLGGIVYKMTATVDVTAEQKKLLDKYNLGNDIVFERKLPIPFTKATIDVSIKINDLIRGLTVECDDVFEIPEYEAGIREACNNFKSKLLIMENFTNREVIEF